MESADRTAVVASVRRGVIVAEIRRAAGADTRPEIREQTKKILRRAQVVALRQLAEETIAELERTGDRRAALRAMLNGPLDPRRGP
jgi:hypothetical protein